MLLKSKHISFKSKVVVTALLLLFSGVSLFAQDDKIVVRKVKLMGSLFEITIVDQDSLQAQKYIDLTITEIERIENLISEWRPHTQISEVNRNAGIQPVKVNKEVFDLTKRAITYSEMSDGAFDISIVALDKVWVFDGSMYEMPSEASIKKSVEKVNYKNIILDSVNSTIFLLEKDMKIGFGSIGKGYAADKARSLLQGLGVKAGIVNASGDIATWGMQPNNKSWRIGINNPFKKNGVAKILKLKNSAVATSGSYEKYAEIDDKRYSHIINPKTGMPATGLTSVTIYGPSAEFANALSTSVMVLGEKAGKELIAKYPNYKFIFITDTGKIIKR